MLPVWASHTSTLRVLPFLCALARGTLISPSPAPAVEVVVPDAATCTGSQQETGICPGLPNCQRVINCEFAEWEDWYYAGGCTGVCYRHRGVARPSNEFGDPCSGPTVASKTCLGDAGSNGVEQGFLSECPDERASLALGIPAGPPQDCAWGAWSAWTPCSRSCGTGARSRAREIEVPPRNGGAPCGSHQEELAGCNAGPCTHTCVDSRWGPWGEWQACPAKCGAGLQQRNRREEVVASACGRPAVGSEHEFRACEGQVAMSGVTSIEPCSHEEQQQVCALGEWSEWSTCALSCGLSDRIRRRSLVPTTKVHLLEGQFEKLLRTGAALNNEVAALRIANESLRRENRALVANLTSSQARLARAEQEAGLSQSLENELIAQRLTNEGLQEQNNELIAAISGDPLLLRQEAAQSASMMRRNGLLRGESAAGTADQKELGQLKALQERADKLRARNVALRTDQLALDSENQSLRVTADRLRLAIPVACGTVALVVVLGAIAACVALGRVQFRGSADDGTSPASRVPRRTFPDAGASCDVSPKRALLRGASGYGGDSFPGSPMHGARGTLLSSPTSPSKAPAGAYADAI